MAHKKEEKMPTCQYNKLSKNGDAMSFFVTALSISLDRPGKMPREKKQEKETMRRKRERVKKLNNQPQVKPYNFPRPFIQFSCTNVTVSS